MDNSEEKNAVTRRRIAGEIASELGGMQELPGLGVNLHDHLSPLQSLLVSDAFGLCCGLSTGMIKATDPQPRIRDNLLRVAEELSREPVTDKSVPIIEALKSIVSRAAGAGLTAEIQAGSQVHRRTR